MSGRLLPVGAILGIDVGAELETLNTRQLQGVWQVPAELVRHAVRRGATTVAVTTARSSVEVRAVGAALPAEELDLLATVFDRRRAASARHHALVALEQFGAIALVWAAGSGAGRVEAATSAGGGRLFSWRPGRAPKVEPWTPPDGTPLGLVRLRGGRLELDRAGDWVRSACRFAPVAVEVNRVRLEPRFPDGLLRARLERPLPAVLSVAATGEAPLLWLLQHGVVSTRATVPGYPAFQAAVELGVLVNGPVAPAALREAVAPYLAALVDQAVRVLLRAADRLDHLPPVTARRVVLLLLEAAGQGLRGGEVEACALLPAAGSDRTRWSLAEVRDAVDRGAPPWVLEPTLDPNRFTLGGRGVLLLGREERRLVRDLAGVALEAPGRRRGGRWYGLVGWLGTKVAALRPGTGIGRTVPWERLTGPEQRVVEALSGRLLDPAGKPVTVGFTSGCGRPRRAGRRLDLPRRNPEVAGWVAEVARHPAWLYPLALAVAGADLEASPELRQRWLDSCGVTDSGGTLSC